MKIVAAPGARLAVFDGGRILRHRYITDLGVFDAKIKAIIAPTAEVEENDYYRKALANGSAVRAEAVKTTPQPQGRRAEKGEV